MPSPITAADFDIQNFSGDVCERIRKLLEINDTLKTFFEWAFDSEGNVSSEFKLQFQEIATPVGAVLWRPISDVPSGYLIANGTAVSRTTYANLFAVYGTTFGTGDGSTTFNLPNLSGKFLLGRGPSGTLPVGSSGGAQTATLALTHLPNEIQKLTAQASNPGADNFFTPESLAGSGFTAVDVDNDAPWIKKELIGGGQSFSIMPPYQSGVWLVKT